MQLPDVLGSVFAYKRNFILSFVFAYECSSRVFCLFFVYKATYVYNCLKGVVKGQTPDLCSSVSEFTSKCAHGPSTFRCRPSSEPTGANMPLGLLSLMSTCSRFVHGYY